MSIDKKMLNNEKRDKNDDEEDFQYVGTIKENLIKWDMNLGSNYLQHDDVDIYEFNQLCWLWEFKY